MKIKNKNLNICSKHVHMLNSIKIRSGVFSKQTSRDTDITPKTLSLDSRDLKMDIDKEP